MSEDCPKCGVDVSQSSGVVCPECGFVIQPGADCAPLLAQEKRRYGGMGVRLSFLIPGGMVFLLAMYGGQHFSIALLIGAVIGGLFAVAWCLAGRMANNTFGQLVVNVLLFVGVAVTLGGIFLGGCVFVIR